MRRVIILFVILILIVLGSIAYVYWPSIEHRLKKMSINKEQQAKDLEKAKELLNQSKPEAALAIIHQYSEAIDNKTETGKEWLDLLIRASEATLNLQQLLILYDYYPKAFESHEKASLLVADAYLVQGRGKDYQALRDVWKGREAKPETWFVLDADKLLLDAKRKEAIDLLNSKSFPGKSDTPRLIRLALLNVFENPKQAWDYLNLAYNKDPENPEILSYRAKLLETVGKNNLALIEYLAAIQTDPKNLYLRDQLAEFYLRNKQYPFALQVWSESLKPPSLDFIWLKAIFWNKVAKPLQFDWKSVPVPNGRLKPLIEYLLKLKPGQFWDTSSFEKLEHYQEFLKTEQATFWLRLLEALKQNKEKEASDLLEYNPFRGVSWNVNLEEALKKILLYRMTAKFTSETEHPFAIEEMNPPPSAALSPNKPLLFSQLDYLARSQTGNKKEGIAIPADLKELLKGPDAYAAAFLATGWNEAALQLNSLSIIPKTYPEWFSYELTQAFSQNRGIPAAIEFATMQNQTKPMSLLIGELLLANGNAEAALDHLTSLAKDDNDIGIRAAWLVSLIDIDRGQYNEAKEAIQAHPKLVESVLGKETLARIALLEGNNDKAYKLYREIEKVSAEAKSYLARKAFLEKDWKTAHELTEELLREYPTNTLLQENLKKIIEEENKAKNPNASSAN